MRKFRKKPVVIEAIQLTWKNWEEICEFCNVGNIESGRPSGFNPNGDSNKIGLLIPTLEGTMEAKENDWIIKEPFDKVREFYPCKPEIFELTYEEVGEENVPNPKS